MGSTCPATAEADFPLCNDDNFTLKMVFPKLLRSFSGIKRQDLFLSSSLSSSVVKSP